MLYYTWILPLSYQIDLRKLRFYHAKHPTESIVWHALTAVSKRQIDIIMADYSIYSFSGDAVYTLSLIHI